MATQQTPVTNIIAKLQLDQDRRHARAAAEDRAHEILVLFAKSNASGLDSGVDIDCLHGFFTELFLSDDPAIYSLSAARGPSDDSAVVQSIETLANTATDTLVRMDEVEASLASLVGREDPAQVMREVFGLIIKTNNDMSRRLGRIEAILEDTCAFSSALTEVGVKPVHNEIVTDTAMNAVPQDPIGSTVDQVEDDTEAGDTARRQSVPQLQTLAGALISTSVDYQESLFSPEDIPTQKRPLTRTIGAYAHLSIKERMAAQIRDVLGDLADSYQSPLPIKLIRDEIDARNLDLSNYADINRYIAGSLENHSLRFGQFGWWPTSRPIPTGNQYLMVYMPRNKSHRNQGTVLLRAHNKMRQAEGRQPCKLTFRKSKTEPKAAVAENEA